MAKAYLLRAAAQADIQQIIAYIAADNPIAARKLKTLLMHACVKLGQYPELGQVRKDLTTKPVRFWPVYRNYMIIYDPSVRPVQILRVYVASRHIAAIMPE